jgi:iron-sulfur cluster repair protein YtfE (RIC family)
MSAQNLDLAAQFAPIVERVHGANHPELTRVRELTEALQHTEDSARTSEIFIELRRVTKNYSLPADACEAYTATYESLKLADEAHRS